MSLALVAVIMFSGHLRMSEIVSQQGRVWNVVPQFPAFLLFLICALAEVNRPPFDLAEARDRAGGGLPHRVLGHQVRAVLPGRVRQHRDHLRGRGDAVPRRVARVVAVRRRVGVARAGAVVRAEGHGDRLRDDPDPGDAATDALRPPDELRVEVPDPPRVVLGLGDGSHRRPAGPVWRRVPRSRNDHGPGVDRRDLPRDESGQAGARNEEATRSTRERRTDDVASGRAPAGGALVGAHEGLRDRLQADLPARQHRAVPEGDRRAAAARPHGPAPLEPARERPGEVHRLRAVRLRVPGRRDLGRGRGQRSRRSGQPRRAAREGLTRSTTCAASCAVSASRRARRARSR